MRGSWQRRTPFPSGCVSHKTTFPLRTLCLTTQEIQDLENGVASGKYRNIRASLHLLLIPSPNSLQQLTIDLPTWLTCSDFLTAYKDGERSRESRNSLLGNIMTELATLNKTAKCQITATDKLREDLQRLDKTTVYLIGRLHVTPVGAVSTAA